MHNVSPVESSKTSPQMAPLRGVHAFGAIDDVDAHAVHTALHFPARWPAYRS